MRKKRQLLENASYHVTARVNHRKYLLEEQALKELFLKVVARAKKKYDFRLENFVLMGNHFHFIIKPGKNVSLSDIMKWILQVVAMHYNRITGISGHFWEGRFTSRIIEGFRDFLNVFSYIDHNPVRAGLVKCARLWDWGGIGLRRRGIRGIVDELPYWLLALFPQHGQLLLAK